MKKNNFNSIILSITDDCNLKCRYCFVKKQHTYMSLDIAKKAIDLCNDNNRSYSITFFGGEPTLLWNQIIVPTVLYAEEQNKKINFSITSNGTLLDEQKLQFMVKHDIKLLLSMDGDYETQNYNRPCVNENLYSFNLLAPKLPLIINYLPNTTVRGTIYPDTCHLLFHNLMFCHSQGFHNLYFIPDEFSDWPEDKIQILKEELRKYTIYYLNSYRKNEMPFLFSPFNSMLVNYYVSQSNTTKTNTKLNCDTCNNCGFGEYTIAINYSGNIYACQELTSNNEKDNIYIIGDINSGIDIEKQKKLKQYFFSQGIQPVEQDSCLTCNYQQFCKDHFCHANSYIQFKNLITKTKIRCIWDQSLYQDAAFCYNILVLNKNEMFLNNIKKLLKEKEG